MRSHIEALDRFERRFDNKIKQAKMYPTWAVVVFIMSVWAGVVSVWFVFMKLQIFQNRIT